MRGAEISGAESPQGAELSAAGLKSSFPLLKQGAATRHRPGTSLTAATLVVALAVTATLPPPIARRDTARTVARSESARFEYAVLVS